MRITPIQTLNNNTKPPAARLTVRQSFDTLSFAGKKELVTCGLWEGVKNLVKKAALPAAACAAVPQILPRNEEEIFERNNLYLDLKSNYITPQMFYEFYAASPELARAIVKSGRRVSAPEFAMLTDMANCSLKEKQCEALQYMFAVKHITKMPVFEMSDIASTYMDALDEDTCDAVINNKDKLSEIFSNIPVTLNKGKDYINTAIVLETKKNIDTDEIITYFETMSEYNLASMLNWADADIAVRKEVLERLGESEILSEFADAYISPINPSEDLLKKFDLIEKYENSDKGLQFYLKYFPDILDNEYGAAELEKGLERLKSLPPEVFDNVRKTLLGDIIVKYETLRKDGRIPLSVSPEDYYAYAKNAGLLNEGLKDVLVNSEVLLAPPKFNAENQKIFEKNAVWLNKIDSFCNVLTDGREILDLLLNKEAMANFQRAESVIADNLDYIVKEVGYKCENTNPVFADIVRNFLSDKSNLPVFITTPDISKDAIVDNFFQISKIRPAIAKEPEKYINNVKERYSDLELCLLAKYLELGNYDRNAADEFFNSMDAETRDKLHIAAQSIDYNNKYYLGTLYNAVAVTDMEYVNMLLSKRLNKFRHSISNIQSLSPDSKKIINKIIRHGKNRNDAGEIIKLSGKQKRVIVEQIPTMEKALQDELPLLVDKYSEPVGRKGDFVFDLDGFLKEYSIIIFEKLGYDRQNQEKYAEALAGWDKNYIHHLLVPNSRDKGELKLVFDLITRGEFNDYITNSATPHGKSNLKTKKSFEYLGLDYDRWLKGIEPEVISSAGKNYTIGLIDRSEKNMIFMGNYTSCCTALNEDRGDAVPNYLLNTAFNIIGVSDEKGDIAATSRIFVSTSFNDAPMLIIDNIEVSNKFRATLNAEESQKFAQQVWDYINKYAQSLSDRHIPVFMSHKYPKIVLPERPLVASRIKLAGDTTKKQLYINTIGEHVDTRDGYGCDLINIFYEH